MYPNIIMMSVLLSETLISTCSGSGQPAFLLVHGLSLMRPSIPVEDIFSGVF